MPNLRAVFISQPQFDAWANATKARNVYALGAALRFAAADGTRHPRSLEFGRA